MPPQIGTMVTYILDALRYKEAALAAVWATLVSMNFVMLLSGAMFAVGRPIVLSILLSLANGATLLLIGAFPPRVAAAPLKARLRSQL